MEVPKTDRRIAQARQLFDDDVVAGHRYGAASKRPNFRQHLERRSESGDLREDLLGSADHLSVVDVVSGLVPRADQSPVRTPSASGDDRTAVRPPRRGGRAPTHFLPWHYATHTQPAGGALKATLGGPIMAKQPATWSHQCQTDGLNHPGFDAHRA